MATSEATLETINKALAPALVALCRARPADPVEFLAKYLLEHKPAPSLAPAGTRARFAMTETDGDGAAEKAAKKPVLRPYLDRQATVILQKQAELPVKDPDQTYIEPDVMLSAVVSSSKC